MPDDYDYQERAAILEYDGGLPRALAEAVARREIETPRPPQSAPSPDPVPQRDAPRPPGNIVPYAVAAARASPAYRAAREEIGRILNSNSKPLKG